MIGGAVFVPLVLAWFAYSRPGYFNQTYLGGIFLLEFLLAALVMYRRVFFPLVIGAFLFAGLNLPLGSFWTAGRWVFLGVGALAGTVIMLKDRSHRIGGFHVLAFFAILAALVSAAVCRYTWFSLLKVLSLFLLFLYATTGARLAVAGREGRFFTGLLAGCELLVAAMAVFYLAGIQVMGNPNSLGAVMGVAVAPTLLWGSLLDESPSVRYRRLLLCGIALYMVYYSESRAAIAAAFLSCGVLCLALRRYKLLAQGMCIIVILMAASAILDPQAMPNLADAVMYKGKDPGLGLLASRQTPWQGAMEIIHKHFWFGSGFGITDTGEDASAHLGSFRTIEGTSRENGSSYLTIVTWVGIAGVAPFLLLVLALVGKIIRTLLWMLNTENPCHPAVPLAIVTFSGLVHSGLEDWLFAPGYYLCVFFWSMAFILVDCAPQAPLPSFSAPWRARVAQTASSFAPSR
jgi:hypothetical protein